MVYNGKNGEYFEIIEISNQVGARITESKQGELSMLWFEADHNSMIIDGVEYQFNTNDILFLTEFHNVEQVRLKKLRLLKFNKPFYCILDHDSEVGCKGILFFGASVLPVIKPENEDLNILETVWKMLSLEMVSRDNLQLEMLQMMLKRMLILCTRIYKKNQQLDQLKPVNADIVREFNYLVEKHFKEKQHVSDYAELLFKSPKTLSNHFKKLGTKTPLQFIHERIVLEARRLLKYSDKSISEIAYEIGFIDVQTFSRFFKKQEGASPNDFRKN